MWNIHRADENGLVVLAVSGAIASGELKEFQKSVGAQTGNRNLVLDLRCLRLVDQATVTFLSACESKGITLRNCPAYIRTWIDADPPQTL